MLGKEDKAWIATFFDEHVTEIINRTMYVSDAEGKAPAEGMKRYVIDQIESVQDYRHGLWECHKCHDKTEAKWYRIRFAPQCTQCGSGTKFVRSGCLV